MLDLTGKIALVTGAAQGLGRATAETLAGCGAQVIVNHLNQPDVAEMLANNLGNGAWAAQADVSSEAEVERLFETIRQRCGRLDILVNNAGTARSQDIFETSLEDWTQVLNTNLTSCFLCSRRAMELMREQRSGRIVNISSVVAHRGALFGHVHYAATKSGILGFTKTLARTGAPLGINVNAVAPGIIETELLRRTHGDEGVADLAQTIPLGLGRPSDVSNAVAFLCAEASRYITGATLDVNGGAYFR
ncbi:MAG: short-chain dehydrogenase [Verrucomicrobia bacterium Tous-C9LFEB]|nr:MAG: short-chain dehydrogenase [Verrucomicrobia bacterium Tous-C9LFEB]